VEKGRAEVGRAAGTRSGREGMVALLGPPGVFGDRPELRDRELCVVCSI
jgi:hypothetical protein